MADAQTYINTLSKLVIEIKRDGSDPTITSGKLTGDLIIQDFPELTEIDLQENEIKSLTIKNCPKLKVINVNSNELIKLDFTETELDGDGKPVINELAEIFAGNNKIEVLSLRNCADKLRLLHLPDNKKLKKIQGIERVGSLDRINLTGTDRVHLIHADKLGEYRQSKGVIRGFFPGGKLPSSLRDSNGRMDFDKLKEALKKKIIEQSPLKNTEKERDQKNAELATEVQEKTKLVDQMKEIVKELGLAAGANFQVILTRIRELRKRPEPTDIIARDAKIAELESVISELNEAKKGEVPKKIVVAGLNCSGVSVSDSQKQNLLATNSSEEFKTIMVDLAKAEIGKLERERNTAYNLNIVLGIFLVISLLFLIWLLISRKIKELETKKDKKLT